MKSSTTRRYARTGMIGVDQEAKITLESFMRVSYTRWMMIYDNYKIPAADVPRYKVLNRTRLLNSRCILKTLFGEYNHQMICYKPDYRQYFPNYNERIRLFYYYLI